LLKTLQFVTAHLGAATQLSSTQPFTLYAVRTLAAAYFRVPSVADDVVAALGLTDAEWMSMAGVDRAAFMPDLDAIVQSIVTSANGVTSNDAAAMSKSTELPRISSTPAISSMIGVSSCVFCCWLLMTMICV
jgi:hypothetical protein